MNRGGFSFKTLLGVTSFKRKVSRKVGIPITKGGIQRKIGAKIMHFLFGT